MQDPKYLIGYQDFRKADQPNRQVILADVKAVLEKWFEHGVTYDSQAFLADILGVPEYNNEPTELHGLLETVHGLIKANIMKYKRIPERLMLQLLMEFSAQPLGDYGGKGEWTANFDWQVNGLPLGPVFWSEGRQPKERAQFIGNNWYDLESYNLYGLISERYATERDQWKQPESLRAMEKEYDKEQILKSLGLNLSDRLAYYACSEVYQYLEVSEMLRSIGVNRSPDAIRMAHTRIKKKLNTVSRGSKHI